MPSSCVVRDAKRGWQRPEEGLGQAYWHRRTHEDSFGQACWHRRSQLVLLGPCLIIFLLLVWSPSVHPGLSVKIEAHTQKSAQPHKAMEMSFIAAQDATRAADVASDDFQMDIVRSLVDAPAAPAPAVTWHDLSTHSSARSAAHSAAQASEQSLEHSKEAEQEVKSEALGVLQHLQNVTVVAHKATTAVVQTLELIQPSLGLQANSSTDSQTTSPPSPPLPASSDEPVGSQVHMGFNDKVIHDSSSSGSFSAVNSTDVVPISEMPDQDASQTSDASPDWAQIIQTESATDPGLADVISAAVAAANGRKPASDSQDRISFNLKDLAVIEKFMADSDTRASVAEIMNQKFGSESVSADSLPASSKQEELHEAVASFAEASPEQLSPEVETEPESSWIAVNPYSADLQGMIHPTSRLFRAPGKFPVTRQDLVAAMPTDERHFPIIEASRAWRKDMRTYVALANESVAAQHTQNRGSQEVWGYYPDDKPVKGLHPGDTRAALAPFLAHEAFGGDYKWMLYGDDDTFFFVDGLLELLQDFDPSLPYFITDHYWWGDELNESSNYHPHERAPRCLPCHWTQEDEERSLRADGYRPFQPYIGCPCTAERICKTDDRGLFDGACTMPLWKPDTEGRDFRVYTMHGGAGALMSIGLMERLPLSFMDKCMKDLARSSGGDALISVCLWKAGYGFTDPGYSFYHWEAKSFDPGPENSTLLLAYLEDAISNNADQYSLELLSHVATSHLRSHNQGINGTTQTMKHLADMYENWRQRLHSIISMTQQHAGQHQQVIPALQATTGIANWRR